MSLQRRSYESAGASTPVMGLKIFGYSVLAGIMALFLYFSMTMLANGALQMPIAYRIYEVVNGEQVLVQEMTWEEFTAMDPEELIVTDDSRYSGQTVMGPKNDICAALMVGTQVLTQGLMLFVLIGLTGYYVWVEGDRDRNLVKHHERVETPLRGLWIGLLAAIPSFALYGFLVLGKLNIFAADSVQGVYRLLNPTFTPLVLQIMPTDVYPATAITGAQLVWLFLLQLVLPATCAVAYQLGYHRVLKKKKKKSK